MTPMKKIAITLWIIVVLPFAVLLGLYMDRFPWPFVLTGSPSEFIGSISLSIAIWIVPAYFLFWMFMRLRALMAKGRDEVSKHH